MATVKHTTGNVVQVLKDPQGSQQITLGAAATTLTVPANATTALIQALVQNVRYRLDSDDAAPTASSGLQLTAGSLLVYDGDLSQIRFIREAAGAILEIEYLG